MKDCSGIFIGVGDTVAFVPPYQRHLKVGKIIEVGKVTIKIKRGSMVYTCTPEYVAKYPF
jgi:hypothetical protein